MNRLRLTLVIMAAALIALWLGGAASAFHSGGVGHCDGCHTMHNSQDGGTIIPGGTVGEGANEWLTVGSDPSSTCLSCHTNIYKAMSLTDAARNSVYTPGGDFYWLTQDTPLPRGGNSPGYTHGHNVIAADFSLGADGMLTESPYRTGTPYSASNLGCNSCHDPHGKKDSNANLFPIAGSGSYGDPNPDPGNAVLGNYRLLGGLHYDGGEGVAFDFAVGDPVAVSIHGSSGQWTQESDTRAGGTANHADYGSGMSEWCANCHGGFTADGSLSHRHPASNDAHLSTSPGGHATNYNRYVATGDLGGSSTDSFDRLVPFERGVVDTDNDGEPNAVGTAPGQLGTGNTNGPDGSSNVMCLTCHRAHASPFSDALRWAQDEELLIESPLLAEAYGIHVYYGESIGPGDPAGGAVRYNDYQRSLCNKCHLQD